MTDATEQLRQSEDIKAKLHTLRAQVDAYLQEQAAFERSQNAENDR